MDYIVVVVVVVVGGSISGSGGGGCYNNTFKNFCKLLFIGSIICCRYLEFTGEKSIFM